MTHSLPWTAQQLAAILALASFRALPFVGFVAVSRDVSVLGKVGTLSALGAAVCVTLRLVPEAGHALLGLPGVYAYLALLTLALPTVARIVDSKWLAPLPLCVVLLAVYVVGPATLVGAGWSLPIIVLGWDAALKAFSFCAEDDAARSQLSTRGLLFFMLVSPTVVMAERGVRLGRPSLERTGIVRTAFGLATFLLEDMMRWIAQFVPSGPVHVLGVGLCLGFAYYLSHSGLASLRIGLMRTVGFRIPECYDYPLLASDPLSFWRRWNTWLGSWARRYVFTPVSIKLRRRFHRMPAVAAQAISAVLAFSAIGALHDALRIAEEVHRRPMISIAATAMFAAFGVLTILWSGFSRLRRRPGRKVSRVGLVAVSFRDISPGAVASYLLFVSCTLGMYWLAESVLGGHGLPPPLPSLVWR